MTAAGTGADLEGLEKFAQPSDREEARFFVGREREIGDIAAACSRAFERAGEGRLPAGTTRIVQGAPGAGKTALLTRLQEIWDGDGTAPIAVRLPLSDLLSRCALAMKIVEALDPGKMREFRRTRTKSLGASIRIPFLGDIRRRGGMSTDPSLDAVRRLFPPRRWKRPICLMFDEAQNITELQVRVLEDLHLGTYGVPVVPVLAGLAHTREVIEEHFLSRITDGATHTLGPLAEDEAAAAVEMFLDRFGVDRADAGIDWPREIARRSSGWPQHLHTAMQALARGLLATDGRLADVDGAATLRDARERRKAYYRSRVSTGMRLSRELVMGVMEALPEDGLRDGQVIGLIEKTASAEGAPEERLPKGMDAYDFLDHLIAKGVLQSGERGKLVCPIPSFRDFMAGGFEMAPEPPPGPDTAPPGRRRATSPFRP